MPLFSIPLSGLDATSTAMSAIANNIANLNTPGYTREQPILQEADPIINNGITYGQGVTLQGIESLRDSILQLQIDSETQQQGQAQAYVNAMSQAQTLFPDDTSGIGQQISNFFQSLNSLSTDPSNLALRQSVLSAAGSMASAFNGTANGLSAVRSSLDQNVQQAVGEVNQITQQIAGLNAQIAGVSSGSQGYGSFLDQRDNLVQKLSGLIDVSVINNGTSITLTTKQGAALVAGNQSFALSTALDPASGVQHIYSQGTDITSEISSGQLGGFLQARDQTLPAMQAQLDSLAGGLVQALNTANAKGFDLNGNAGGNLFSPVSGAGAAASMTVAITDPSLLAASSDGTTGSNGNLTNLSAVANQAVSNGMTPTGAYGNLVFQVGTAVSGGNTELDASNTMLTQLQQQQASVSGVSLDEEASNLMLYQRGYQAAAEAISAVDQMMQTIIQMPGANT